MESVTKRRYTRFIIFGLFVYTLFAISCSNQAKPKSRMPLPWILEEAHRYYWNAEFDNALKLTSFYLDQCIKRKARPSKKAFILLPLIYLKQDDFRRAKRATYLLLKLDPKFIPNPNDYPIHFLDLVNRVKREEGLTNSKVSQKK